MLVGEEAAHAGPEAEAVLGAVVECPGEAGGVTRLIPQLSAELGAVLPTAHTRLQQGDTYVKDMRTDKPESKSSIVKSK